MTESGQRPDAGAPTSAFGVDDNAPRLMKSATYLAVLVASLLIAAKTWAWWATGSVALLGSLVDSGLDAMISLVNLVAVHHALTPADREHRFGHGKAEAVAGLFQSVVIVASAMFLLSESLGRLIAPAPIQESTAGIAVMVFSSLLTFGLVGYQRYVTRRVNSVAIAGDSLHYSSDLLMNAGVIVALILAGYLSLPWADGVFGVGIAAYLAYGAWKIARQSFDMVMDRELPEVERQRIKAIVLAHEDVIDMHDLRTRMSGISGFIQFHVELAPDLSLARAHAITEDVEKELEKIFPGAEILIHQDPHGYDEPVKIFEG